jgi:hypothetical protein
MEVNGHERSFSVVSAPPEARAILGELCRVTGLSEPKLVWCDELGGAGGLSGNGSIVIGDLDQMKNAERVAKDLGCSVERARRAALEVAIAHELGHAAMHEAGHPDHSEDEVDDWALGMCDRLGWRTDLHDAIVGIVRENRAQNLEKSHPYVLEGVGVFEFLGAAPCSIAAVRGVDKTTPNFRAKLIQVSDYIGINPDWLAAVISFESNGTFSSSVRNPTSGATGLIQFTKGTAHSLGTTTDALARMTPEQQLDYVQKYFEPYRGHLGSLCSTYAVVFAGHCVGASPDTVAYSSPSAAYEQNSGLDYDRDGVITCREVCSAVQGVLSSARDRRVDSPCTPTSAGGTFGIRTGTLLLGAAAVGAAVTFPYWRGIVGI